ADGLIEIVHIERKPGFRAKVAVISHDVSVDLVGACVGPGGSRTRAISDELGGERIDVIPWSDDAKTNVRAALKPAAIENVIMLPLLGRAIVLVDEKERKIAIGKRGQNVNLASRLCVWDIDVMTQEELDLAIERSREELLKIEGITPELANSLTGEGFFTYDDLSIIDPDDFAELSNGALTPEQAAEISDRAEQMAEALEK
ncbi:MAG: transcription termination factor NusA, partial [Thermoguttaceae bacterium]|nr:transcription termination factor NusA [Thermoguttaceae bacterium]